MKKQNRTKKDRALRRRSFSLAQDVYYELLFSGPAKTSLALKIREEGDWKNNRWAVEVTARERKMIEGSIKRLGNDFGIDPYELYRLCG